MDKINVHELVVRSSIQLLLADKDIPKPAEFGSGCILRYLDRHFLFTVSHLIVSNELVLFLETNLPADPVSGTPLQPIGGVITFKKFKIRKNTHLDNFEELAENGDPVDIAFAEIKQPITLLQPEIDFVAFKVEASNKVSLYLEDAVQPRRSQSYAFFGKIKAHYIDNQDGRLDYLSLTHAFKHSLKYNGKKDGFYEFLTPEIITDEADYQGCSGAPIIDSSGRIVALVCAVFVPSRLIQGIPISVCKQFLETAIKTKML